jgi:hypothetical protein
MKTTLQVLVYLVAVADAFTPHGFSRVAVSTRLHASTQEDEATATSTSKPKKVKELGLLTFDLDDTLYPIAPVIEAANGREYI